MRFAERFEQAEHLALAQELDLALEQVEANRGRLSSDIITELNRLMQRLSRTGLRQGDKLEQTSLPPLRKPVYVALQDHDRGERLAKQLEFFGLSAISLTSVAEFQAANAATPSSRDHHGCGFFRSRALVAAGDTSPGRS
jgi:hypothetical protein